MSAHEWVFTPYDMLFFRDSRPKDVAGGAEQECCFPPSPRTLAGAVRTCLGDNAGVDWQTLSGDTPISCRFSDVDFRTQVGDAAGYGQLHMAGPWLRREGTMLFPIPSFVVQDKEEPHALKRMVPGNPVASDLASGPVRLPEAQGASGAVKELEGCWLSEEQFVSVLNGQLPADVIDESEILQRESHVGIGIDHSTRTVSEGNLFQSTYLRLSDGVEIAVDVDGIDKRLHPDVANVRLGGKGRMAAVRTGSAAKRPFMATSIPANAQGILLVLLTPGDFEGSWLPPGFVEQQEENCSVFHGKIGGMPVRIVSATVGKAVHEGGWDLVNHRPRPVRRLVPAGSTYFCEIAGLDPAEAAQKLNGLRLGADTEIGYGCTAIGYW